VFDPLGAGEVVRRAAITCAVMAVRGVTNVPSVRLGASSTTTLNEDFAVTARQRATCPSNSYVVVQRV